MDFLPVVALGFFLRLTLAEDSKLKLKWDFFSVLKTKCCNHSHLIIRIFSK